MKNILKWMLALFSTALLLCVLYAGMILARVSSGMTLQNEIRNELAENNAVELVLGKKEYAQFRAADKTLLDSAVRVSKLVRGNNIDIALQELGRAPLVNNSTAIELQKLLGEEELVEDIETTIEDTALEESVVETSKDEQKKEEEKRIVLHPLQERAELAKEYLFISSEFAETIGLEDQSIALLSATSKIKGDKSVQRFSASSYASGVFEGLPVIAGLPDEIPNYIRVEQYLDPKTRSSVMARIVRSRGKLRKKLVELQERLATLQEQFTQNTKHLGLETQSEEKDEDQMDHPSPSTKKEVDPAATRLATQLVIEAAKSDLNESDVELSNSIYEALAPLLGERLPGWFDRVPEAAQTL